MRERSSWGWIVIGMMLVCLMVRPAAGQSGMKINNSAKIMSAIGDGGSIKAEEKIVYIYGEDNKEYTIPARLSIQASNSINQVAITNYGKAGFDIRNGILVNETGQVGVGNTDDFAALQGYLQVGAVSPTVLTQNIIGFNTYYNNTSGTLHYVGGPARTAAANNYAAGVIVSDMTQGRMFLGAADVGAQQAEAQFKGLAISKNGVVGAGFDTWENPLSGTAAPVAGKVKLDVKGAVILRNINSPSSVSGYIYGDGSALKACDANGNHTTFSPHDDPREKFPTAQTSFADASIVLPFSFHHENEFIGKGSYVDMAKMVDYIQKKMQSELGQGGGQLVFNYDLPASMRRTAGDYEVDAVLTQLQQMRPVKVTLGADGAIPSEAMEMVDESVPEIREVDVPERNLDLKAGRVVTKTVRKKIVEMRRTGHKTRQFKAGWTFFEGDLYRMPTINDLDVAAIARNHPKLPQWVLDRMQGGQAGQSVSSLVEDIKKILSASRNAGKSPADLAANQPLSGN